MKTRVGLAQINNSFSGQNYLPYSVGLLQCYAEKNLKKPADIEFLLPVYLREAVDVSLRKLEGADIVFFSAYVWNVRQSLEIARLIKEKKPDTVIIFGGPQVPDRVDGFLKANTFIDACVHGEGEQTFLEILESDFRDRARRHDWSGLESVSFLNASGEVVKNHMHERLKEIDQVPSPYLNGTFNALMKANPHEKWILMWETNRGCPFSCAFCDWGSATQSKVFKFSLERLYGEIDWMVEHKIEYVFCADANFGMLERDVELATYVAESKRKHGYPHALSVQNTKNATERAYKVQKLLADAGLNKGVTLSLQSIDPLTLKNIKRANISSNSYQELQRRFTRDKIETYTDIILGLPGETYESFTRGVAQVVENGQHNRIQFNNLSILPNAAMGDPEYQREHGMVLVELPIVNFHGSLAAMNNEIAETQVLVVGTNTCPREDWVRTRTFAWACQLLYFNKVMQIPLLLLTRNFSVPFNELISLFVDGSLATTPALREIRDFFEAKARDIQNGGSEYCSSVEYLNIWWPADELILIKLYAEGKLDAFYQECETILLKYLDEKPMQVPHDIISDAIKLNQALMKLPFQKENLTLALQHNVWECYQAGCVGDDLPLANLPQTYAINRTTKTWNTLDDWCREVIWWGNKKGAYMYPGISNLSAPPQGSGPTDERQISGHF